MEVWRVYESTTELGAWLSTDEYPWIEGTAIGFAENDWEIPRVEELRLDVHPHFCCVLQAIYRLWRYSFMWVTVKMVEDHFSIAGYFVKDVHETL
jgi:hypothetical protein